MKKKKKGKVKRGAGKKKALKKKTPKKKVVKKKKKVAGPKERLGIKTSIPAGASLEEIGVVTHYFSHVEAAVVKLTKGTLSTGDTIIIKGHTSDFKEKVGSMQLDHVPLTNASRGQEIGLKVKAKVREHDAVYKVVT
jgi:putative protease